MLKIQCDKCGKMVDTCYTVDIHAEMADKTSMLVSTEAMVHNTARALQQVFGKSKHYCRECIEQIEKLL